MQLEPFEPFGPFALGFGHCWRMLALLGLHVCTAGAVAAGTGRRLGDGDWRPERREGRGLRDEGSRDPLGE